MISGADVRKALAAGFAAALVLAAGANGAFGAEPPAVDVTEWGLPQLMRGMAEIKSERRTFTERKYLKVLTAPLESSGVLVYQAPGHLEKITLSPGDERMVLDHGVIEIEIRSRHFRRTLMATQYPAVGAFVESMRATLAGDLNALNRYYRVKLEGRAANWRLQLVPVDPAARNMVREIRIAGRDSRITGIEIIESDGDRRVMAVGADVDANGTAR
jgi:Outer membrane lipoprotein carrier protein LolA-like